MAERLGRGEVAAGRRMIAVAAGETGSPPETGPPPPPYACRGDPPPGGRLEPWRDGEKLYRAHCGACHLALGMGTNMLAAHRVALGESPEQGLLENRDDLEADYVRAVVRNGRVAMPRLTRVDVTDAELEAIAAWLAESAE